MPHSTRVNGSVLACRRLTFPLTLRARSNTLRPSIPMRWPLRCFSTCTHRSLMRCVPSYPPWQPCLLVRSTDNSLLPRRSSVWRHRLLWPNWVGRSPVSNYRLATPWYILAVTTSLVPSPCAIWSLVTRTTLRFSVARQPRRLPTRSLRR